MTRLLEQGGSSERQDLVDNSDFFVRFWGTRGSIACPGEAYQAYGGNTSCLEVRCGDRLLILDAGTGIREFGAHLAKTNDSGGGINGDLFLTHTHFDHISGLPFFGEMFNPKNRFRLWAGHLQPEHTLHEVLCKFMMAPLFPIPPQVFSANVSFHDFRMGETLQPHLDIRLRTAPLNHPNHATGYRIEFAGKAICYITDTEHTPGEPDENVLRLIKGADLVIYDSTYTDEEFAKYRGWGHSTWQEGCRLCDLAGAGRLVIFHHDPGHDDAFMNTIAAAAEQLRPGTVVAQEGAALHL